MTATNAWIHMRPLEKVPLAESVTTIAYGNSGSGKTTFIGSAGNDTLIIDNGKGLDALKSPYASQRFGALNPLVITIRDDRGKVFKEKPIAFDRVAEAIDWAFDTQADKFTKIAIDDATMLRQDAMDKALLINDELGKSQSYKQSRAKGMRIVAVQDYGTAMDLTLQYLAHLIARCKANEKHLILASHVRETYTKPDKIGNTPVLRRISPAFNGETFPDDVVALFDNAWFFENVGGSKFRCRTKGDDIVTANTSTGGIFDQYVYDPDFQRMLTAIQASKKYAVPRSTK